MGQGVKKKAKLPFSLYFANGELIIPGGSLKLEHHPYYIFHHCPNQKHPLFYIDKQRLRGRRLNENKYEKLILVIGSSSAFGFQCGDERCWSALLEKIWFRETGYHVRVINAAVVSFITPQMFHQLLDLLQIYKPDYILAMGGWSDWFNIVYHPRTPDLFSFHSTFFHIESLCCKIPEKNRI